MIINSPNKGDILIYVDSTKQKAINPSDLLVVVGTVVTVENDDGTTYKKVGSGTFKKLGVVLSELVDENDAIKRELNSEKIKNKKILNMLTNMVEILVNQAVLSDIQINELKAIKEEINNEN